MKRLSSSKQTHGDGSVQNWTYAEDVRASAKASRTTATGACTPDFSNKNHINTNRLWGLLWVLPASMEYHGVFAGLKKANIYAPVTLHDTQ
jgi:hypothetical protein